jgi:hypothetical protein
MQITSKINKETILKWIVTGLIFVVTFPFFQHTYTIGLDASYVWGLNWLFVNDYKTLIQLAYPFGPLAFLQIPTATGHNLLFFLLFFGIFKIGFIYLAFKLSEKYNVSFQSAIPVVLMVCFFVYIDFLIIGSCIILNLLFYKQNKAIYLYISAILASFGLFVKVSIGISSLSVIFVSLLLDYYYNRNIIKSLKQISIMGVLGLSIGLIVFHGFIPLFRFLWGAYKLSGGYGDTLSLHPYNNWILLSLFIFLIISFPLWNKAKDVRIACFICLFPLFASWKHSFIRQDITHYSIIIAFLFLFWSIILLISKEKRIWTFVVACCTILLLYANMHTIPMYRGINREVVGINNFIDILHYKNYKQRISSTSERNIAPNKLSEEQKKLIGENTIDIYPWEFSYIAANNFHWKPRRTLELGASTSRWASTEASKNYLLNHDTPEFLLFHYYKDGLKTIDDRYLLNDEPLVILNVLNHYLLEEKTDKFLLFKKNIIAHFEDPIWEAPQTIQFNEWLDIPKGVHEIVRLKVFSKNSLLGKIKKMLYKEEAYYVDYLLEDGIIHTYRYISGTAVDGLWCSPFVRNPLSDIVEPDAIKIRLRNSSSRYIVPSVTVQFEKIKLKASHPDTTAFPIHNFLFQKNEIKHPSIVVSHFQDFENNDNHGKTISNFTSSSAGYSNIVEKGGFSYGFVINLDTLWAQTDADELTIEANVEFCNYSMSAGLIISLEDSAHEFWEVTWLPRSIRKNVWHYANLDKNITRSKHNKGTLKCYVLNFGNDKAVYIDNFKFVVRECGMMSKSKMY